MKTVIWIVVALVALLWTGAAWGLAAGVELAARLLASGEAAQLGSVVAQVQWPAWLVLWIDAAWLGAAQHALVMALEWMQQAWPAAGAAVGWLVPLVWVFWGFGLVLLLALGGLFHALVGRSRRSTPVHQGSPA